MIADNIKNREVYEGLNDGFARIFDFIEKAAREDLPAGRYELDGSKVYAMVQEYISEKEPKVFEAHKKYIDLQCVICGKERMEVAELNACNVSDAYNESIDATFLTAKDIKHTLELGEFDFAVFFPNDAHRPGLVLEKNCKVKKVVGKIAVK